MASARVRSPPPLTHLQAGVEKRAKRHLEVPLSTTFFGGEFLGTNDIPVIIWVLQFTYTTKTIYPTIKQTSPVLQNGGL